MTSTKAKTAYLVTLVSVLLTPSFADAEIPDAIAAPGATEVLTLHAEGAQLYECKTDSAGKLTWQFREPIAALLSEMKTVGRHYAGPNWELQDGSAVAAKVAARAPGSANTDIPWLKLDVTSVRGHGALNGVTTVQRINTKGGMMEGDCLTAGIHLSVPYSSDYVFLKPNRR